MWMGQEGYPSSAKFVELQLKFMKDGLSENDAYRRAVDKYEDLYLSSSAKKPLPLKPMLRRDPRGAPTNPADILEDKYFTHVDRVVRGAMYEELRRARWGASLLYTAVRQ